MRMRASCRTGNGGWFLAMGTDCMPTVWASPWFSMEMRSQVGRKSSTKVIALFLIISTLDALTVLVVPPNSPEHIRRRSWLSPRRGNGAALHRLMTTKFAASAVLVETAAFFEAYGHECHGRLVSTRREQRGRRSGQKKNTVLSTFKPRAGTCSPRYPTGR